MSKLQEIFSEANQSPWLDNLTRSQLQDGTLQKYIDGGIRGVTSNPTIFQKSIEGDASYTDAISELAKSGKNSEEIYWQMVQSDVSSALKLMRPVFEEQPRLGDGCVSLEVSPDLAHNAPETILMGKKLWAEVDGPNLMIKVPATKEGLAAITELIAAGVNVNVTLIFSLDRYRQVIDAFMLGLEKRQGDLSHILSVASFFISRTDTEVDKRLEAINTPEALSLKGKAAIASAIQAYGIFQEAFSSDRWKALIRRGANAQRPLWASTSTKNPSYPDLLYVDELLLPHTVNTMPDATVAGVLDHGKTVAIDFAAAKAEAVKTMQNLAVAGIDMNEVCAVLETEGVDKFQASYKDVLAAIDTKAAQLLEKI